MKIWIGRPSGHSVNYTLIGTFETDDEATKVFNDLNERFGKNEFVYLRKNQVRFNGEAWGEEDFEQEIRALEELGATSTEAIPDLLEFTAVFTFDAPYATAEEIRTLLLLKYPELANYLEGFDEHLEHKDGKTKYVLSFFGDGGEESSNLFSDDGNETRFLGRVVGKEIDCEIVE